MGGAQEGHSGLLLLLRTVIRIWSVRMFQKRRGGWPKGKKRDPPGTFLFPELLQQGKIGGTCLPWCEGTGGLTSWPVPCAGHCPDPIPAVTRFPGPLVIRGFTLQGVRVSGLALEPGMKFGCSKERPEELGLGRGREGGGCGAGVWAPFQRTGVGVLGPGGVSTFIKP